MLARTYGGDIRAIYPSCSITVEERMGGEGFYNTINEGRNSSVLYKGRGLLILSIRGRFTSTI